jgi:hypothetical protein
MLSLLQEALHMNVIRALALVAMGLPIAALLSAQLRSFRLKFWSYVAIPPYRGEKAA